MRRRDFNRHIYGAAGGAAIGAVAGYLAGRKGGSAPAETAAKVTPTSAAEDLYYLPISGLVEQLNRHYKPARKLTPEDFVWTARTIYFEGAYDTAAIRNGKWDLTEVRRGLDGIASVILNRQLFSVSNPRFPVKNVTGNNYFGETLSKVITQNYNGNYEFAAIFWNSQYFINPRNSNGQYSVATMDMDIERAALAKLALIDALTGRTPDPTKRALYYKNTDASPGVVFHDTKVFDGYTRTWSTKIGSHDYYTVSPPNKQEKSIISSQ